MTRPFADRADAGRQLGAALQPGLGARPAVVVLGLPRGGVVVAAEVARVLAAPLDVLVVRKVGTPTNPELALGAVLADGPAVLNPRVLSAEQLDGGQVERLVAAERARCAEREGRYRPGRPPVDVEGRTVLLVDDGLATGATMRAAVAAVRGRGAGRVVVAVPVGPRETLAVLQREADEVVCLRRPLLFRAVGWAYADFRPTTDDDVVALLRSGPA
ncbi:MAG: phosphoribosyltransferase [Actinomycetia bacterium]|nr:phosphoribosyltransferase [Actinomycetes bacterium]